MALSFGFYNSIGGDRKYNAEEMGYIIDCIITNGVFADQGEIFATVPGNGLQVIVKPGMAWFNTTWTVLDTMLPLNLTPPDVTLKRYDAVVLEVNKTDEVRANSIKIVTGAPAANPVKPTPIVIDDVHQHILAYVLVEPGVSTIAESKIEIVVGQEVCPFSTSVLESVSISDLFNQWQGEFDEWFENLQASLSGDIATNLQNQINQKLNIADKATPEAARKGILNAGYITPKTLAIGAESAVMKVGDIKISKRTSLGDNYILCNGTELTDAIDEYPESLKFLTLVDPFIATQQYKQGPFTGPYEAGSRAKCAQIGEKYYVMIDSTNTSSNVLLNGIYFYVLDRTTLSFSYKIQNILEDNARLQGVIGMLSDGTNICVLCNVYRPLAGTYDMMLFYKKASEILESSDGWTNRVIRTYANAASTDVISWDRFLFVNGYYIILRPASNEIVCADSLTGNFSPIKPLEDSSSHSGIIDVTYGNGYWVGVSRRFDVYYTPSLNTTLWTKVDDSKLSNLPSIDLRQNATTSFENGYFLLAMWYQTTSSSTTESFRVYITTDPTGTWTSKNGGSGFSSTLLNDPWGRILYSERLQEYCMPCANSSKKFCAMKTDEMEDGSPTTFGVSATTNTYSTDAIYDVCWDGVNLLVIGKTTSNAVCYIFYKEYYKAPSMTITGSYYYMKVRDD